MERPATKSERLEVRFSLCRTIHKGDDRLKTAIVEHLQYLRGRMYARYLQSGQIHHALHARLQRTPAEYTSEQILGTKPS